MNLSSVLCWMIIAYLVGSVPTGFIVARLVGLSDIRDHGSGNIGATNVARVLGVSFFPLIFFIDAAKAYGILALCAYTGLPIVAQCCIAGALLAGNICSIFLSGSGGKGVATAFGICAALCPFSLLPATALFVLMLGLTRTVGISSVIATSSVPLSMGYFEAPLPVQYFGVGMVCAIIWRHRENIRSYSPSLTRLR